MCVCVCVLYWVLRGVWCGMWCGVCSGLCVCSVCVADASYYMPPPFSLSFSPRYTQAETLYYPEGFDYAAHSPLRVLSFFLNPFSPGKEAGEAEEEANTGAAGVDWHSARTLPKFTKEHAQVKRVAARVLTSARMVVQVGQRNGR